MKINQALVGLFILSVAVISLRAQPVGVQQMEQTQRSTGQPKPVVSLAPGETAPELYEGENTDVGPQRILKVKPQRKTWFEVVADSQYFYTANAFLSETRTTEASVFVNTIQAALAPAPYRLGEGRFAPALGFRSQWYNYDGSGNVGVLDFNAQTAFVSGRYRFGKSWELDGAFEYTRLLSQRNYTEFYNEYVPTLGLQKLFPIGSDMLFALNWQTAYHFSWVPNPPRSDINDRWDHTLTVSFSYQIVPKLIVQPYYRVQYTYYPRNSSLAGDRNDVLNSAGLSLAYYFNPSFGVRTFYSYAFRESDDVLVSDYSNHNGGLGVALDVKF